MVRRIDPLFLIYGTLSVMSVNWPNNSQTPPRATSLELALSQTPTTLTSPSMLQLRPFLFGAIVLAANGLGSCGAGTTW